MKVGDKVRHKKDGTIAEVVYSTFGFSLHWYQEGELFKTLGTSAQEILEHWEPLILHDDVEDIICPHCGIENNEYKADLEFEGSITCSGCQNPFDYSMTITYTTFKIE